MGRRLPPGSGLSVRPLALERRRRVSIAKGPNRVQTCYDDCIPVCRRKVCERRGRLNQLIKNVTGAPDCSRQTSGRVGAKEPPLPASAPDCRLYCFFSIIATINSTTRCSYGSRKGDRQSKLFSLFFVLSSEKS